MADLQNVLSSLQALSTFCRLLFCLQILENVVKHRWGTLDCSQRADISDFVRDQISKLSIDEQLFRQDGVLPDKLNMTVVQVGVLVPRLQSEVRRSRVNLFKQIIWESTLFKTSGLGARPVLESHLCCLNGCRLSPSMNKSC